MIILVPAVLDQDEAADSWPAPESGEVDCLVAIAGAVTEVDGRRRACPPYPGIAPSGLGRVVCPPQVRVNNPFRSPTVAGPLPGSA
ncbi:hypothetical protein [Streptomyces sp. R33]|uniref:Uncharacterized protein n=1 Tax=Streptomyces sp. R33 TaxID=3238629 RepID=A0AB39YET8_9ACTN